MSNPNIVFCRMLLKEVIKDAKKAGISAATIKSASVGRLSDYRRGQKYFEFYVPYSYEFKQPLRLEVLADNAYHARALAWMAVIHDYGLDKEEFGVKEVLVRDYKIPEKKS